MFAELLQRFTSSEEMVSVCRERDGGVPEDDTVVVLMG